MDKDKNADRLDSLISRIAEGQETIFTIGGGEEGKEKTVKVERRKLHPEKPVRDETPKREHTFFAVDGFIDYLKKYGGKDTVIYMSPHDHKMWATLNERAEKGVETVMMTPRIHPKWEPWSKALGRGTVEIKQMVDFLRENRRTITKPEGGELVLALSQIRASVSQEMYIGSGRESTNGLIIKSKIQGDKGTETVELPETLMVNAPLYLDTDAVDIEIDLILETQNNSPIVYARIGSSSVAEGYIKSFEQMAEKLKVLKEMTITYGIPNWSHWEYENIISD